MEFKERVAYESGYRPTPDGGVIGPRGNLLKVYPNGKGYLEFKIKHDVNVAVHRFIAYCKFGDKIYEPGLEVRHKKPTITNTHPDNLLLGTKRQNHFDKSPETRKRFAEAGAAALRSLSTDQVIQLRKDRVAGYKYKDLVRKYGIAKSTVSYIVNRKTYSGVAQ
jgi:hypothetical protein